MFGELGDSDIYENNRGGGFDASDADANFAFDTQNDVNASVSDDFLDTYSDAGYAQQSQQQRRQAPSQGGILGAGQAQQQQSYNQGAPQPSPEMMQRPPQKGQGLLYVLVLVLLFVGAAGMFFYKKNAEQVSPAADQAMGDYFYDKAADNNAAPNEGTSTDAQASAPQGDVATVDVELAPGVSKPIAKKDAPAADKKDIAAKDAKEKPMNAIEKAMAKKKADAGKENRVGLGSVVIPVASGGRADPFMPYNQVSASAVKPKFDLVAPPMEIPEADPMIDKVLEFKLTGIMYDNVRPSAILSVDGTEQLVHKGDVVMGYKILDITRKTVTVKYKTNTYEVSAGQSLNSGVNLNPVSSLSKQFGGAYSGAQKNVIQFNN